MYFDTYPLYKSWFRQQLKRLRAASQQLCAARLIIANFSAQLTGSSAPSRAVSNTTRARVSLGLRLAPALVLGRMSPFLLSGLTLTVISFTPTCLGNPKPKQLPHPRRWGT